MCKVSHQSGQTRVPVAGAANKSNNLTGEDKAKEEKASRYIKALAEIQAEAKVANLLQPTKWTPIVTALDSVGWFVLVAYLACKGIPCLILGLVWGVAFARSGFAMHMALHNAVFPSLCHNIWFATLVQNFLMGTSWRWWKRRHQRHHADCNVVELDPDLRTNTLLIWDDALPTSRATTIQRTMFPIYMSLYMIFWQYHAVIKCLKHQWWSDLCVTILHWVCLAGFWAHGTSYTVVEFSVAIFLSFVVSGWYFGYVFLLNHFLEPHLEMDEYKAMANKLEQILATTRNIDAANRPYFWVSGGMSLQIEHHLFPNCPMDQMPVLAEIVQGACRRHGLPYKSCGARETLVEVNERMAQIEVIAADRLIPH